MCFLGEFLNIFMLFIFMFLSFRYIIVQQNLTQAMKIKILCYCLCFLLCVECIEKRCGKTSLDSQEEQNLKKQSENEFETTFFRELFNVTGKQPGDEGQCPQNSFCKSNGFCKCNPGFILDCETPSHSLTFTDKIFSIQNDKKLYFDVLPLREKQYFFFTLKICEPQQSESEKDSNQATENLLEIQMYADFGVMNQIDDRYKVMNGTIPSGIKECYYIQTPVMMFGSQKNGQLEQLLITIERKNRSQYELQNSLKNINNTQSKSRQRTLQELKVDEISQEKNFTKLQISIMQINVYSPGDAYLANMITFFMFFFSSLMTCLTFFLFWLRYRRYGDNFFQNQRIIQNDLSFFEKYIPKYKMDENSDEIKNLEACSICILEFQEQDEVRKTNCNHVFHSECLDQWCKNNLTCPVCRSSLSRRALRKNYKKNKRKQFMKDNPQNAQEIRKQKISMIEEDIIYADRFDGISEQDDPMEIQLRRGRGSINRWMRTLKRRNKRSHQNRQASESNVEMAE